MSQNAEAVHVHPIIQEFVELSLAAETTSCNCLASIISVSHWCG